MWCSIYNLNLTDHSDPDFKLVQVLEISSNNVIFDLRQTNKGRKTKAGIYISVSEFEWFKRCLKSTENRVYTLEHGTKTIRIDKTPNQVMISLCKFDGIVRKIVLENYEYTKLVENLNEIESKLITRAMEMGVETEYGVDDFVREM